MDTANETLADLNLNHLQFSAVDAFGADDDGVRAVGRFHVAPAAHASTAYRDVVDGPCASGARAAGAAFASAVGPSTSGGDEMVVLVDGEAVVLSGHEMIAGQAAVHGVVTRVHAAPLADIPWNESHDSLTKGYRQLEVAMVMAAHPFRWTLWMRMRRR